MENNTLREKLVNNEEMVKKYESAMNDYTLKKMDPKFKELMVKLKNENEAYKDELVKREEEKLMLVEQIVNAKVKLADIELYRESTIQPSNNMQLKAEELESELMKTKEELNRVTNKRKEQEAQNNKLIALLKKNNIPIPSH